MLYNLFQLSWLVRGKCCLFLIAASLSLALYKFALKIVRIIRIIGIIGIIGFLQIRRNFIHNCNKKKILVDN